MKVSSEIAVPSALTGSAEIPDGAPRQLGPTLDETKRDARVGRPVVLVGVMLVVVVATRLRRTDPTAQTAYLDLRCWLRQLRLG